MIINISGNTQPTQINSIQLNQFDDYSIRLIAFHAIFTSKADFGIYQLCTNLIDRERGNSHRILAYIRLDKRQTVLDFTPTQSVWYKLRFKDISSAVFRLQSTVSDDEVFFTNFACQFEIIKNARIQQFDSNKKPANYSTSSANENWG